MLACKTLHHTLLSLALLWSAGPAALADEVCAWSDGAPKAGNQPFTVHGRLAAWNGAPTHRIWIVGTQRMLGVRSGTAMPENLLPFTQSFDVPVMGDFVLCPLTPSRPGVMQMVRIVSASHLHPQPRAKQ